MYVVSFVLQGPVLVPWGVLSLANIWLATSGLWLDRRLQRTQHVHPEVLSRSRSFKGPNMCTQRFSRVHAHARSKDLTCAPRGSLAFTLTLVWEQENFWDAGYGIRNESIGWESVPLTRISKTNKTTTTICMQNVRFQANIFLLLLASQELCYNFGKWELPDEQQKWRGRYAFPNLFSRVCYTTVVLGWWIFFQMVGRHLAKIHNSPTLSPPKEYCEVMIGA